MNTITVTTILATVSLRCPILTLRFTTRSVFDVNVVFRCLTLVVFSNGLRFCLLFCSADFPSLLFLDKTKKLKNIQTCIHTRAREHAQSQSGDTRYPEKRKGVYFETQKVLQDHRKLNNLIAISRRGQNHAIGQNQIPSFSRCASLRCL